VDSLVPFLWGDIRTQVHLCTEELIQQDVPLRSLAGIALQNEDAAQTEAGAGGGSLAGMVGLRSPRGDDDVTALSQGIGQEEL
jgi:hypothetical protein